ncbi:MAG: UDP-N-acetylmuramate--L-alanine ligase [Chitinophagales bacterium]|nr:UDP-N-acetylmuramate--L-alanine ligase [Chitinophagales bacterium]
MKGLNDIRRIFFAGIGGIGMSALARYFKHVGVEVFGYDKTRTALTQQLEAEGMHIHYEDDINLLPEKIDLVVYTPAIPKDHKELNHLRETGHQVLKRSEVLEILTADKFTIAVAGSHGKTTVTSMIAHILNHSGYGCTAFLGGIALNYHSNFIAGNKDVVVVEADEFDRSFLRLTPSLAVITAVDTDHLDIYGSREKIEEAFLEFTQKVKPAGEIIAHKHVSIIKRIEQRTVSTYGLGYADYHDTGIMIKQGAYHFEVESHHGLVADLELHMGGRHNVENAVAAITVALKLGIAKEKIREAIASFKGIHRRFEYVVKSPELVFIDDYAHHPEEIRAFISSVRELYPEKKLTAVFQPHLFSRTNDLYAEFAKALELADEVILLDIYPARELPMAGVTSALILNEMKIAEKSIIPYYILAEELGRKRPEVLLTIGAGDIDALVNPIKEALTKA